MKYLTLLLAGLALCLPLHAEKVIVKAKNQILDSSKKNHAFYVFEKAGARKYRGKEVVFKMDIKHVSGIAALGARMRCSTKPGGIVATKTFKLPAVEVGKSASVELVFRVPDVDNISHFNILTGFRKNASENTVWEIKNPRFCEYAASAKAETAGKKTAKSSVKAAPKVQEQGASAQLGSANSKKPLELVKNGKICFSIVTREKPDHIAKYAAQELQLHFKLSVGSAPRIITENEYKSGPAIFVGDTAVSRKYGIAPAMLAPETLAVARVEDKVVLAGGDNPEIPAYQVYGRNQVPVGTLYAVYEFLERELGIRWYWPGKNGTHVPKIRDLKIGRLFVTSRPASDTRKTFYATVKNDPDVTRMESDKWYRRNRFGGSIGDPIGNHSFNRWIDRFAKTHPEYLALQADGTRKVNPHPGGGHVCMSHPGVFKQTVADKLEEFRKQRFTSFAKVMPGDSNGLFYCQCKECRKKVRPEKGSHGLYSDVVWGFVNKVAAEVAKKAPGKTIVCCAYAGYMRKPSFALLPNVGVTLCFPPVPRAVAEYKDAWKSLLDEWSSTGARLYVWEYWNLSRSSKGIYGAPAIYARQLKEIYAIDAGRIHGRVIEMPDVNAEGKPIGGWADWIYDVQNLYIAGKLMWNPGADVDKILDDYYTEFFGPAAAPVRQFHEEMENAWEKHGFAKGDWNYERIWTKLYPPAFVDRMMGLLRQAVKMAPKDSVYAWRARKLLNGYKYFDINSRMFRGGKRKTNPATVTVPRISDTPKEADWKKAVLLKDFCDNYNVYPLNSETTVQLLHNGTHLFFKASCRIPVGVAGVNWAPASVGKRDALLWNYESIEFFLGWEKERYQFILAPDSCLRDGFFQPEKRKAAAWNAKDIKWSTVKKGIYWEGYLAVPLKELKFTAPRKNGEFRFNIYRNCKYNMPGEPMVWEQGCYLPAYGGFHNIDRFGTLKLGK